MSGGIINTIFALLVAVTLIAIFWGIIMYYAEIGSQEANKEFKGIIIGGITILFLLMCFYGLLDWARGVLGI